MPNSLMNAVKVSANVRKNVFDALGIKNDGMFTKVDDSTFGTLMQDENGKMRYARVKVVVANLSDVPAEELMKQEIEKYQDAQVRKAERAAEALKKKEQKAAEALAALEAAKAEAEAKNANTEE